MGTTATEAGADAGTEIHAGYKGVHPTPPNPNTDRGSSAVIIPTAT